MSDRGFGEADRLCFEKGQIMFGIGADHDRRGSNFARRHDDHPAGVGNDMMRGEHIPIGMDDDAGP